MFKISHSVYISQVFFDNTFELEITKENNCLKSMILSSYISDV